jgi:chorismate-pyruvate lyase
MEDPERRLVLAPEAEVSSMPLDTALGVSLSLFQKILLTTDGSVTELLSLYASEPISVKKIEQSIRPADSSDAPAVMACAEGAPLLHRKIMLVDAKRKHVYAESTFVFERFSKTIQAKLLETDTPIGLLWKQEKVEMYREIIDVRLEQCAIVAAHFGLPADTPLLSRTYLLHQQAKPLGVITEKFPLSSFQA